MGNADEPPANVPRISIIVVHDDDLQSLFGEEDMLESSAQHWKASEELSVRLNNGFVKSLSGFENRQIVRGCPPADVVCVYTPTLLKFLPDLIPNC